MKMTKDNQLSVGSILIGAGSLCGSLYNVYFHLITVVGIIVIIRVVYLQQ